MFVAWFPLIRGPKNGLIYLFQKMFALFRSETRHSPNSPPNSGEALRQNERGVLHRCCELKMTGVGMDHCVKRFHITCRSRAACTAVQIRSLSCQACNRLST